MTEFDTKVAILSELWTNYKDDKDMQNFFEYNDIGLPLSFMIEQNIVDVKEVGVRYINETFELLCDALGLDSEEEYESIHEMFDLRTDWEEVPDDEQ